MTGRQEVAEDKERKRPRGRPKLPPGLKADQFSIALPPAVRVGLEMLARHRGVSLSKAVEFCVSMTLRDYEIDGGTLLSRIDYVVPPGSSVLDDDAAVALLNSPGLKVLWMPASLRSPEEAYFTRVVELLGGRAGAETVEGDLDELLGLSKSAFAQGVEEKALADHWMSSREAS